PKAPEVSQRRGFERDELSVRGEVEPVVRGRRTNDPDRGALLRQPVRQGADMATDATLARPQHERHPQVAHTPLPWEDLASAAGVSAPARGLRPPTRRPDG